MKNHHHHLLLGITILTLIAQSTALNYACHNDQILVVQSFGNDTIRMHCQRLDLCGYQKLKCDYDELQPQCGGKLNFVSHVNQKSATSPVEHTCCNLYNPREPHTVPTHSGNDCFIYELPDGTSNGNKVEPSPTDDAPYAVLKNPAEIPQQFDGVTGYRLRLFLLKKKSPPTLLVKGIERRLDGYRVTICRPRCTSSDKDVAAVDTENNQRGEDGEWKAISWSSWSSSSWSTWARHAFNKAASANKGGERIRTRTPLSENEAETSGGAATNINVNVESNGNNNNSFGKGVDSTSAASSAASGSNESPSESKGTGTININIHTPEGKSTVTGGAGGNAVAVASSKLTVNENELGTNKTADNGEDANGNKKKNGDGDDGLGSGKGSGAEAGNGAGKGDGSKSGSGSVSNSGNKNQPGSENGEEAGNGKGSGNGKENGSGSGKGDGEGKEGAGSGKGDGEGKEEAGSEKGDGEGKEEAGSGKGDGEGKEEAGSEKGDGEGKEEAGSGKGDGEGKEEAGSVKGLRAGSGNGSETGKKNESGSGQGSGSQKKDGNGSGKESGKEKEKENGSDSAADKDKSRSSKGSEADKGESGQSSGASGTPESESSEKEKIRAQWKDGSDEFEDDSEEEKKDGDGKIVVNIHTTDPDDNDISSKSGQSTTDGSSTGSSGSDGGSAGGETDTNTVVTDPDGDGENATKDGKADGANRIKSGKGGDDDDDGVDVTDQEVIGTKEIGGDKVKELLAKLPVETDEAELKTRAGRLTSKNLGAASKSHAQGSSDGSAPKVQGRSPQVASNSPAAAQADSSGNVASDAAGSGGGASGGGRSNCFSADTLVTTVAGEKRMDELEIGDYVLVPSTGATLKYERVEMFYHREPKTRAQFVVIYTKSGKQLSLTHRHLMPIGECHIIESNIQDIENGIETAMRESRYAEKAKRGDCVMTVDPSTGRVIADKIVRIGRRTSTGIYSPMTVEGSLIVDGVLASCFSHLESHTIHKVIFDFLYTFYNFFGFINSAHVEFQPIPNFVAFAQTLSKHVLPSW